LKKAVKISILGIVLLFFIISAAGFLILKTDTWKKILFGYVNSQLSQRFNMRLESEGLSGNLFYNLSFDRLTLVNLNQTELVTMSGVSLTYNLKSLISFGHLIHRLRIDSLAFSYPDGIDSLIACLPEKTDTLAPKVHFNLQSLSVNHWNVTDSHNSGQMIFIGDSLKASLTIAPDTIAARLVSLHGYLPGIGEHFRINDANLALAGGALVIRNCRLHNQGALAEINGLALLERPFASRLDLRLTNFHPGEKLPGLEAVFQKSDHFNLRGQVETRGKSIALDVGFSGQWRGRNLSDGRIAGKIDGSQVDISKIAFKSAAEKFAGDIHGRLGAQLIANLKFVGIDAFSWGISSAKTNLQGDVRLTLEGSFSDIDQVTAFIDLQESKIAPLEFNRVKGELVYKDGFLAIVDTFKCLLGETKVELEGGADLKGKTVDARAYFSAVNANLLSSVLKIDTLVGTVDGFVEATGALTAPDLRGWFRGDQFGLPNLKFEESVARFGLVNIREQKYGDIFIEATNCQTNLIPETVPLTSLIVRFEGDTTVVQMFKAVGANLDLEIRGNIVHYTDFNLNSIRITRSGNVLENVDPIYFSWKQDTIALEAVRFRLNEGLLVASGRAVKGRLENARIALRDLSIEPFNAFIRGARGVRGILAGEVAFEHNGQGPQFSGELGLKDARLVGQVFKDISLKGRVNSHHLWVDKLVVQDGENGLIRGHGLITCDLYAADKRAIFNATDSVALTLDLTRFDMEVFDNYLLKNIKLDGAVSGQISIYNYLNDPRMNYDLAISNPVFDKLTGKEMTFKGLYQGNRLSFTEATLTTPYGVTRGRGYLPYAVSFVPGRFAILQDAPLSMNFSMKTSELDFLTAYLDAAEEISGDFNLAMSVSGTPAHPIRAGNLSAKDAIITISAIENPITGVSGSAVMENNRLEIISLTGYLKKPHSPNGSASFKDKFKAVTWDVLFPPQVAEDLPNLTISGGIDFTEFFRPRYDITLKGEELYLRTLLAEQEGVVTGSFTMTGRDSILYEGEVEVEDFIIRNEFAGREEVIQNNKPSKFYSAVNLHLIIPGSLQFKNAQLDGDLDGEMWIIRNGDEPYRFSGTLDILDGSFYYYGWEFEVVSGSISFDPIEFNPTLDIEAQVDLAAYGMADTTSSSSGESELVTVYLTGYLDNPSLEFESANYSQSDILMFLSRAQNIGSETTGQDQLSASAANVVGSWFERQIERNIGRMAGLDDFELRTNGNLLSSNPTTDQWSVVLGRKLASNLYVKYERTFSLVEPNQQFGLEYRLNRNMSIAGDVDQEGLLSINYRYKYRY